MTRIAILGSTGSIGKSALDVVRHFPGKFKVTSLSTNSNIRVLRRQIAEFKPRYAAVRNIAAGEALKKQLRGSPVKVYCGEAAFADFALNREIEKIVLAISGSAALMPLINALKAGKTVCLANKEALVMAGSLVMESAVKNRARIIPVDSEQSAIWQCIDGVDREKIRSILLTASGGPLRLVNGFKFKGLSVERVLAHPRWKMGKKITVDSATLMNKGLEVLEAMFLFGLSEDKIKTVIHPQAIIHSMVEFIDGVVMAQLSATDMRIPIQYALTYPERFDNSSGKRLDFYKLKGFDFEKPDLNKFPCLRLAYKAARQLGTLPAVLNAANEVAVDEFLKRRLDFSLIPKVIEEVMNSHKNVLKPGLGDILYADIWARQMAGQVISVLN